MLCSSNFYNLVLKGGGGKCRLWGITLTLHVLQCASQRPFPIICPALLLLLRLPRAQDGVRKLFFSFVASLRLPQFFFVCLRFFIKRKELPVFHFVTDGLSLHHPNSSRHSARPSLRVSLSPAPLFSNVTISHCTPSRLTDGLISTSFPSRSLSFLSPSALLRDKETFVVPHRRIPCHVTSRRVSETLYCSVGPRVLPVFA